jgi:hypothetical protein
LGFAPTPQQYRAYEYAGWHEKGKKAVPAHGGARDTFWTNVGRGQNILTRIAAVGGASTATELRHKELIQSPKYILEQLEKEAARLAEITRLELVEKNRLLDLESQRLVELEIAKQTAIDEYIIEQKEITRIGNQRLEDQRLEKERIELENQTVVTPIPDITNTIITIPQGYHKMPDGTIMKGSKHKTEREKLVEKTSISILVIGAIGLYLALRFKS